MNEPFVPLPIPSPPESGFGAILARVFGRVATWRPRTGRVRASRTRRRENPRLAAREVAGPRCNSRPRFPVLPPPEF